MKLNLVASYLLPNGKHFSAVHAINRTNNLVSLNEMTSLTFPKAGGGFLRVAPSVLMMCPSCRQDGGGARMNYLKEHWGTLALVFASVAPFAGWCVCDNLPAVSCVPVAVTAVCGVVLGVLKLCGIFAED